MNPNHTYAISGGNQYTVDAARQILDSGGNAIDAAIAAYWMCMVAEPFMASAGAGGFALVREPDGKMTSLDFFCQTPKNKKTPSQSDLFPITVDFGATTEKFYVGMASVAVPGAMAVLWEMHRRWATIPMKELVQPAMEATKLGIPMDEFQSYECQLLKCIYELDSRGRDIFLKDSGELKGLGDKVSMEHFSDFASSMAIEGVDLFYKGEIANSIVDLCKDRGGNLTMEDFGGYQLNTGTPFSYVWKNKKVHSNPFPSVGAMIQGALLKGLENHTSVYAGSATHFDLVKTISKEVYDIKHDLNLLKDNLSKYGVSTKQNFHNSYKWGGTSHFNISDKDGLAISLSTSIGEGNGTFIPNTDMQLNNMLGELALLPNGIHSWDIDVRLQSMMCPTMITDLQNQLLMQIGSGGAGRIPFSMAQTIYNHFELGMDMEDSVSFPRIIYDGKLFQVEEGYENISPEIDHNVWDTSSLYFGGTHVIGHSKDYYEAVGDPRRYGKAFVKTN